jgi:hypothetical protein
LENLAFLNPDSIDVKRSAVTINLARCLCKVRLSFFAIHSDVSVRYSY